MIGRVDVGVGSPLHNGLYVAEIYWGWKLLEWKNGEWWHPDCAGRWSAGIPVQWVGPLPARKNSPPKPKPDMVFDL